MERERGKEMEREGERERAGERKRDREYSVHFTMVTKTGIDDVPNFDKTCKNLKENC